MEVEGALPCKRPSYTANVHHTLDDTSLLTNSLEAATPRVKCRLQQCSAPSLQNSVHCIDHHTIPLEHKRAKEYYADFHSEAHLPHPVRYTAPMPYIFKSQALSEAHKKNLEDPNLFTLKEEMSLMRMCVQAVLAQIPADVRELPDSAVPALVALLSEASKMISVAQRTEDRLKNTYNVAQINDAVEQVAVLTLPYVPVEKRAEFLSSLQGMSTLSLPDGLNVESTRGPKVATLRNKLTAFGEAKLKDVNEASNTQNEDEGFNLTDDELAELKAASEEVRKAAPAHIA